MSARPTLWLSSSRCWNAWLALTRPRLLPTLALTPGNDHHGRHTAARRPPVPPPVTNAASISGQSIPRRLALETGDNGVVPGGAECAGERHIRLSSAWLAELPAHPVCTKTSPSRHQADDHTGAGERRRLATSAMFLLGPCRANAPASLMLFQVVSIQPSER